MTGKKTTTVEQRFFKKVVITDHGLEWAGYISPHGYGRFGPTHSQILYAHRWAYEWRGKARQGRESKKGIRMTRALLKLTGTTPLLCHNIQLNDPDNDFTRLIAEITAKKNKKTDQDRAEIARLEWFGGLYTAPGVGGPLIPTGNIRKCLIEAAKVTRQGRQIGRGIAFIGMHVPLIYEGPRNLEELQASPTYNYRVSVNVTGKRVIRIRPQFPVWAVEAHAEIITDIIDPDDVEQIVKRAGLIEGLGDNRVNGFGRFTATMR